MFKKIETKELGNPFDMIGNYWMLITAKDESKVNTMTASWGGMGHLWNKDVVYIFVRPGRYTYEFIEKSEEFTLTFFQDGYREKLTYLGKISGRDENKIEKAGLSVVSEGNYPYFKEGKTVVKCNKLYKQRLDKECFLDASLDKFYKDDYHYMYIGEIVEVLRKEV
ncbi:flavin reductase [uncultured Ilyobacter sp.]|uniref:flavin reductase family protein n=1 Tax=uncultured Ilyobacter sp. TaxID=544433 RepID=UPI0029F4918E|nr:flavin reductase [uncultured Ilyobacter sp.]